MGFLDLFVVALMPVLKVLLITGLGLFLALDRIDLLGANARHYMNNSAEDTDTNQSISDSESYKALLLSRKNSGPSGCSKEDELPVTISEEKLTVMEKIFQPVKKLTAKINLKMVFAPATIAAVG
ncbi:hypothetical protein POTOM_040105 [Populus tomentosa]|uniref:Uncharacterized protein n=1 Tax=Populus tomentosa TaxID=118781 RepID=A0A8X8CJN2_POPTO|nr:hypothetical protein POTOM_040105 [Populus tomentosa]